MSKYLTLCDEYRIIGLFTKDKSLYLKGLYNALTDENKVIADKHAELLMKRSIEEKQRGNLASIKSNIQFLAWVMIINLVAILYFVLTLNT